MVAMIHKSISAFHLVPAVLSNDISRNDIVNIYNKVLSSYFGVPKTYNSLLLNTIFPIETPLSWTFRIAQKSSLKLRANAPDVDVATGLGKIFN